MDVPEVMQSVLTAWGFDGADFMLDAFHFVIRFSSTEAPSPARCRKLEPSLQA